MKELEVEQAENSTSPSELPSSHVALTQLLTERARDELNEGGDMLIANPNHRGAEWPSSDSEGEDSEEAEESEEGEEGVDFEVDRLGNRVAKTSLA